MTSPLTSPSASTGTPPRADIFIADLPFGQWTEDGHNVGELRITDELRVPGTALVRLSVLATVADVVAGVAAMWPPGEVEIDQRLALTLDLTVRVLRPITSGTVTVAGNILKRGKTTILGEVTFTEQGATAPGALSHVSFVRSPRPGDIHLGAPPATEGRPTMPQTWTRSFGAPFAEKVGALVTAPGVVEIDLHPYVTQLSGTLQGGVVALLGELAAESLGGRPVRDLDVRYLSAVRVGPARTSSTMLDDDTVRVEIRDAGNADRLASLVVARLGT